MHFTRTVLALFWNGPLSTESLIIGMENTKTKKKTPVDIFFCWHFYGRTFEISVMITARWCFYQYLFEAFRREPLGLSHFGSLPAAVPRHRVKQPRADSFGSWVMPTEACLILNQMAVGQQIPAGLHCIIQPSWTRAPAVSELTAAIELLLPPICTQSIERLLQPCPRCLSSNSSSGQLAALSPRQRCSSISNRTSRAEVGNDEGLPHAACVQFFFI